MAFREAPLQVFQPLLDGYALGATRAADRPVTLQAPPPDPTRAGLDREMGAAMHALERGRFGDRPVPAGIGNNDQSGFSHRHSANRMQASWPVVTVELSLLRQRPLFWVAGRINSDPGAETHRTQARWFMVIWRR